MNLLFPNRLIPSQYRVHTPSQDLLKLSNLNYLIYYTLDRFGCKQLEMKALFPKKIRGEIGNRDVGNRDRVDLLRFFRECLKIGASAFIYRKANAPFLLERFIQN